jgi:hypothetical protein
MKLNDNTYKYKFRRDSRVQNKPARKEFEKNQKYTLEELRQGKYIYEVEVVEIADRYIVVNHNNSLLKLKLLPKKDCWYSSIAYKDTEDSSITLNACSIIKTGGQNEN